MSLEIREMIIRTTLTDIPESMGEKNVVITSGMEETDAEYIIEQCIARVMDIIKEENDK